MRESVKAKQLSRISELLPDDRNVNRGTERGRGMLEDSLRQLGAGRSIVLDKHGRIIAGNKTVEVAADIGLEDMIVVQSDGTKLVAVQRTDWDLETDAAAKRYALADNRVGQVDLDFDPAVLAALQDEDAELLKGLWTDGELEAILEQARTPDAEFKEYTEDVEKDVKYCTCPACGHKFPQ